MPITVNGPDADAMAAAVRAVWGNDVPIYHDSLGSGSVTLMPNGHSNIAALRRAGDAALKARDYSLARRKFQEAAKLICGTKTIPLEASDDGGVICAFYKDMDISKRIELQGCCRGMGAALARLGQEQEALQWLEECRVLDRNMHASGSPIFAWYDRNPMDEDYYKQRILSYLAASDFFRQLGNTGACVHRKWNAHTSVQLALVNTRSLEKLIPAGEIQKIALLCHPDADHVAKVAVKNDRLQMHGSWRKVELAKSVKISARMGFAHFVWRSRLYVLGGEKNLSGPEHRDFWFIDLEKLEDGWHSLPGYSHPSDDVPEIVGRRMVVHNDKAYLFRGSATLDVFDLQFEIWSTSKTKCEGGGWTCAMSGLRDFAMQAVEPEGRIYVFGGTHSDAALGCSIFMVLDIASGIWRKLSGAPRPLPSTADASVPGPRRLPTMWYDKESRRIFLMYGEADRLGARMSDEPGAGSMGYGYDDFWSWDIDGEQWRRERVSGNSPCPRSEMGYTFNEKLSMAVVFGGYSPTLPTSVRHVNQIFQFTYYADTFVYTSDEKGAPARWKHVLTRGFPTYRAQAALVSDPDTGRMFLFGGYTNSEFVPDGKHIVSKAFGDLWELRLDTPGSRFEDVDLEEEARTAKAGPWQRCFNCGSAGPWKKCGGSCRGRVFFCDSDCLKEGWREHKQKHKCAKK